MPNSSQMRELPGCQRTRANSPAVAATIASTCIARAAPCAPAVQSASSPAIPAMAAPTSSPTARERAG